MKPKRGDFYTEWKRNFCIFETFKIGFNLERLEMIICNVMYVALSF